MIEQIISVGGTALITAIITAYTTAKANEKVLGSIVDRLDNLEDKVFDHEKRISQMEGKIGSKVI